MLTAVPGGTGYQSLICLRSYKIRLDSPRHPCRAIAQAKNDHSPHQATAYYGEDELIFAKPSKTSSFFRPV